MAVSATRASVTSSASRYVFGRPETPRGMIVETRAKDATGSSGLRANEAFRPPSSLTRSVPQTWQKCATSGREVLQRGHSTRSLSDRPWPVYMAHAQTGVSEGRAEGADRLSGRFFGACGGISCKGHEALPEPGHLTLEIGWSPGVVDHHVGGGEPMVTGGLRGDPGMAG